MEEKKKVNKNTVIMVAVAAICLALVIFLIVRMNKIEKIDADFFKSDDSKLVLSLKPEAVAFEEEENEPLVTHIVYYIGGDKINNIKVFYEYESAEKAQEMFDKVEGLNRDTEETWFKNKSLNDKYIVFQAKDSEYEDLLTSEVKEDIEDARLAGKTVEEEEPAEDESGEESEEDLEDEPEEGEIDGESDLTE